MMRYSAVLLCLSITLAHGQLLLPILPAPPGCGGKAGGGVRPESTCETEYLQKCYNPRCFVCAGQVADGICPGAQKCCLPPAKTGCENQGGECVDPTNNDCRTSLVDGGCPAPKKCCEDTQCEDIFVTAACINRPTLAAGLQCDWRPAAELCGGPPWVQCCIFV